MTCRNLTALYTKFRDDHKKANNPWPEFLPQLDDLKQVVQAIPSWTKKSSSNCLQVCYDVNILYIENVFIRWKMEENLF